MRGKADVICCFPDPYPDELFYSICARFHRTMKYGNHIHTSQELFGSATAGAAIDLPQRLAHLVSALPPGNRYTVDSLIQDNSLLPLYAAFLPGARVAHLKIVMAEGGRGGISTRSNIRRLDYFRFCILCATEDREKFGETYWHRIHQAPGMLVCHLHNVLLDRCHIDLRSKTTRLKFINADQTLRKRRIRPLDLASTTGRTMLQIAHDVAWLLSRPSLCFETQLLHDRYRKLLKRAGFLIGRTLHTSRLVDAFTQHYGSSHLQTLRCEVEGYSNWLVQLFLKATLHSPLHNLLAIQFLHCSPEQLFAVDKKTPRVASQNMEDIGLVDP